MKILLVDDHPDTAHIMSVLLQRRGHDVTVAMSVHQAIDHLADNFDLLVSDLGLPDGSGLDIMQALARQKPIPGIAVSGHVTAEDREKSKAAGFDEHLCKPIDLQSLLSAIDRAAEKRFSGPSQA